MEREEGRKRVMEEWKGRVRVERGEGVSETLLRGSLYLTISGFGAAKTQLAFPGRVNMGVGKVFPLLFTPFSFWFSFILRFSACPFGDSWLVIISTAREMVRLPASLVSPLSLRLNGHA
jgi:hypothetical protein